MLKGLLDDCSSLIKNFSSAKYIKINKHSILYYFCNNNSSKLHLSIIFMIYDSRIIHIVNRLIWILHMLSSYFYVILIIQKIISLFYVLNEVKLSICRWLIHSLFLIISSFILRRLKIYRRKDDYYIQSFHWSWPIKTIHK